MRFPSTGIDPLGTAADPARDNVTGLLVFSGSLDNVIAGVAQLSHGWDEGTACRPHIHLRWPTAASGVDSRWLFEYDIANVDGSFSNAYGTYTTLATITVPNPNNSQIAYMALWPPINMTGYTVSAVIMWRVTRLSFSDAADTDTSDIAMIEFDIYCRHIAIGKTVPP